MNGGACDMVDADNEPVVSFSNILWAKLMDCLDIWASLNGKERLLIGLHRKRVVIIAVITRD